MIKFAFGWLVQNDRAKKIKLKEKVMKKLTKKQARLEEKEKGHTLTERLEREKAEDWKIFCRKLNLKIN